MTLGYVLLGISFAIVGYAYAGYPLCLALLAMFGRRVSTQAPVEWPEITVTVPAYNEERAIANTLDRILEADYPPERRHVLVVSDASTDRTDEIVRGYASRGVHLVRLEQRGGKTAAENAARAHLRGEIIINTDASVRIDRGSLKPLVTAFSDATVGVASSRDVSVAKVDHADANVGESAYVGMEMWVRELETRVSGIVGASGCLYAIRRSLHMMLVPEALSRDFAAALLSRETGHRSVSVNEAICYVPRQGSLRAEYRRKVRTLTRGLETLYYKRALLNPLRYGVFAWQLFSHKLARWLVPWAAVLGLLGVVLLSMTEPWARWLLAGAGASVLLAMIGWRWPEGRSMPKLVAVPTYVLAGLGAGLEAWMRALKGELNPVWEPTRRET